MPFADDVRKYTFASLERLFSKEGEEVTTHPYLPTETQLEAMDNLVDAIDLMDAGEKDEDGYVLLSANLENTENFTECEHHGLITASRTIPPSTELNKPCSTALSSLMSSRIRFLHPITSY